MGDVRARLRTTSTATIAAVILLTAAPQAHASTTPAGPGLEALTSTVNCQDYRSITDFAGLQACENDWTFTVRWAPPTTDGGSPITGYTVSVRPAGGTTWTIAGTVGPDARTFDLTPAGRAAAGLLPVQAFEHAVAASNALGTGPASDNAGRPSVMLSCTSGPTDTLPCPFMLGTVYTPGSNVFTFTAIPRQYPTATQTAKVQFGWRYSGTETWTIGATTKTSGTKNVTGTLVLPSEVPIDLGWRAVSASGATSVWGSWNGIVIPVMPDPLHPCLAGPPFDPSVLQATLAKSYSKTAKYCAVRAPA